MRLKLDDKPAPLAWEPRLKLSEALLVSLRAIVQHETKHGTLKRARKKIEQAIADAYPERIIRVDLADVVKRAVYGDATFGVVVDGVPDQVMIFSDAKADGTFYGAAANGNRQRGRQ